MELEAEKPTHRAFANFRQTIEYFIAFDAFVVANGYLDGIHESDAGTFAKANKLQEQYQRYHHPAFKLDKSAVGQLSGKFIL
jgi:hypothetical protein